MEDVKIIGVGHYCPENKISNDDLANIVETSDEWIYKRTGIKERRISNGEDTVELSVKAAKNALENSKCDISEIDLVIVATTTPDRILPSTACSVQKKLGIVNAAAFDISAACSGFIYGSIVATSILKTMEYTKALVIGSEVLSRIINWKDRSTCVLFGDGAGAAILEKSKDNSKIISSCFGADGERGEKALKANELSLENPFIQNKKELEKYIYMDGKEVFKFAISIIPKVVKELLEKGDESINNIKYIVPHQANSRIIDTAAKKLNISKEVFYTNLSYYGNTSAASIPIALSEMNEKGLLKKGDKIILVAFGGGLTWAGMLVQW